MRWLFFLLDLFVDRSFRAADDSIRCDGDPDPGSDAYKTPIGG